VIEYAYLHCLGYNTLSGEEGLGHYIYVRSGGLRTGISDREPPCPKFRKFHRYRVIVYRVRSGDQFEPE